MALCSLTMLQTQPNSLDQKVAETTTEFQPESPGIRHPGVDFWPFDLTNAFGPPTQPRSALFLETQGFYHHLQGVSG
jgi:hypothetical protein